MLPLTVWADKSALAPAGRFSSTAPLTVLAEMDFTCARLTNAALTAPFTLDRAVAGEILVTDAVFERARPEFSESRAQDYRLKLFDEPMRLWEA